jgi:YesN/AraC family two-component response regulator
VELPCEEIFVTQDKQTLNWGIEKDLAQMEIPEVNIAQHSTISNSSILVVEDNTELRGFLQLVLSRNYNCLVASNGAEGWEIIKNKVPSVIISDVIMPEMDGYELCEKVKQRKETCHIPVILLTAKNDRNHQIKGYDVGADAFVTKPFEINVLLSQVSRLMKNRDLIREKYKSQNFMVEVDSNSSKDEEFIQDVKKHLEENLSDPEFNVKVLSKKLNISTTQLYRKLKVLTGHSPVEFIRLVKLQKAYALLGQKNKTVKEVCYLTGFNNLSYFIKCFKEQFGVTPASYRDKGKKQPHSVDTINNSIS